MLHLQVPTRFSLTGVSFNRGDDNTQHNIDVVTLCDDVPLALVREPDNPYDSNAIQVVAWDQFHLGYIPKAYNHYLAQLMDTGSRFEACNYQRNEHPHYRMLGISIEIREVSDMQKIVFK